MTLGRRLRAADITTFATDYFELVCKCRFLLFGLSGSRTPIAVTYLCLALPQLTCSSHSRANLIQRGGMRSAAEASLACGRFR